MPEFYNWVILLINQSEEIVEKQLSDFGSIGGQNSPSMQVPLFIMTMYKHVHVSVRIQREDMGSRPPINPKNIGYLTKLVCIPWKSQSFQASIQCLAIIGTLN